MTDNDTTLHLWFKPVQGLNEPDLMLVNNYGKRFYPRPITQVAQEMRKMAISLTKLSKDTIYEYQMRHYTRNVNNRYVIEETLRDATDVDSFTVSIQNTNTAERKFFLKSFEIDEQNTAGSEDTDVKLVPVANVIAYLEDSLRNESHRWENARLHNGQDATSVLTEIINFLKSIKTCTKVYDFSLLDKDDKKVLTLALVCPNTLSYYTRIDWTII